MEKTKEEYPHNYFAMLIEVIKWEKAKWIKKADAEAIKAILRKYNK